MIQKNTKLEDYKKQLQLDEAQKLKMQLSKTKNTHT